MWTSGWVMNVQMRVRISGTQTHNINYSSTRSHLSGEENRSENCKCKRTFKSFHAAFLRVILFCNIQLQLPYGISLQGYDGKWVFTYPIFICTLAIFSKFSSSTAGSHFAGSLRWKIENLALCILHRTGHFVQDVRWQYESARVGEISLNFTNVLSVSNHSHNFRILSF
jgi:hypothetical protein